jgi:pimeloyl-ACP methyl ester carboxylesterase
MRTLTTLTFTALAACNTTAAEEPAAVQRGRAAIHGVDYYYEIHGRGEPLLLLHGGLGSIDMFGPVLPALAADRQVIAVDLHGHGRTPLGDRPISMPEIADDLAVLIDQLGHTQVDAVGYSFGGGIAFRLAVQHPDKVRRLVVVSAPVARDGWYPEMIPQQEAVSGAMAGAMKDTPMYQSYAAIAPEPGDFPRLLDRMGEMMRIAYDWRAEVARLTAQTMLVVGDSDMVRLDHAVEVYQLLGGGQRDAGWQREHVVPHRLAILPDVTHYDMFASPQLVPTVRSFLD